MVPCENKKVGDLRGGFEIHRHDAGLSCLEFLVSGNFPSPAASFPARPWRNNEDLDAARRLLPITIEDLMIVLTSYLSYASMIDIFIGGLG
jgi:hypothetical protein